LRIPKQSRNFRYWILRVKTFPHHKHEDDTISESQEITLEEVIQYIEEKLLKKE